jgi:predicted Fe-Mo cluster-binding NifX family protein
MKKIAVGVHGKDMEIFVRVGRAPWFAIFEESKFVELRPNNHASSHDHEGGHHGGGHGHGHSHKHEPTEAHSPQEVELHRKDLENLSDIDVILVRAIGPNMKEALELNDIEIVKMRKSDGNTAEELIQKYLYP